MTEFIFIAEGDTITPHFTLHTQETVTDFRMELMAPFSSRDTWA